jgi:UDP:flavonoid glycosyltransferase YjiC (YdhE family)
VNITVATIGARGDVEPALALALGLARAGHAVTFVGPLENRQEIEGYGLAYFPLEPAIPELETPDERESVTARIKKFRIGREHIIRQFDRVVEAARNTDLILASITFAPAALTARDLHGVPACVFHVAVPFVRTGEFANPWLPALPFGRVGNRLSYILFEQVLWQTVRGPVNRWRRSRYGLPGFSPLGFFKRLYDERVPLLLGWSREVYPPAPDFPPEVHVTGRWFLPHDSDYRPPREIEEFLAASDVPLCITFGSNPIADKERTLQALLGALRETGRRAILVGAASGLGQGVDLHGLMITVSGIPFSWLFPRIGLVVHHGGCGVSACCLEAGVPCIVVPTRPDQLALGRRLHQLGVAPHPIPLRKLTAKKLAAAIVQALSDGAMTRAARHLSPRIREEDGVGNALACIERIALRAPEPAARRRSSGAAPPRGA